MNHHKNSTALLYNACHQQVSKYFTKEVKSIIHILQMGKRRHRDGK